MYPFNRINGFSSNPSVTDCVKYKHKSIPNQEDIGSYEENNKEDTESIDISACANGIKFSVRDVQETDEIDIFLTYQKDCEDLLREVILVTSVQIK